ncbi:MAG TPA: BON domain-containing protein [Caldimonas sp.]|jgi:osmotically-inducible protein OsmY|nr:BON domain-containing protein [Caldimonas sp.]
MSRRDGLAAVAAAAVLALGAGCAMMRGQESIGAYVDDSAITSSVKSRMVEDKTVDAEAIRVETSNGNVVLSGLARTPLEKNTAESIAMKVRGVKTVQNNVAVRP